MSVTLHSSDRGLSAIRELPRAFSFLEEKIKPHLQARSVSRGKVDVFIGIDVIDSPIPEISIDEGVFYMQSLRQTFQRLCFSV